MSFTILEEKLTNNTPKKDYIRKGISIPFKVDASGKISLSTGQDLDEQGILINLLNSDNNNAFFQIDNFESYIFQQNSSDIVNDINERLNRLFRMFENQHRMKLISESVDIQQAGEYVYVNFEYFNYETNETRNLSIQGKL
jgi:hypothetical protein